MFWRIWAMPFGNFGKASFDGGHKNLFHSMNMNLEDFLQNLSAPNPALDWSPALCGLWWDANGKWEEAHKAVQEDESPEAAWVHAYLHRKQGDVANADYWYKRADKIRPLETLAEEWESIVRSLLGQ